MLGEILVFTLEGERKSEERTSRGDERIGVVGRGRSSSRRIGEGWGCGTGFEAPVTP